jgi:hypothetical protein
MRRGTVMFNLECGALLAVWLAVSASFAQEPTPAKLPAKESAISGGTQDVPAPPTEESQSDKATPAPRQKTLCVPQIVMERRVVKVTEYRPEWRECPVTIVNHVPETTWVDKEICLVNPERRITLICERICRPIIERQEITYCASEPVHCVTPCKRTVCKPMPVKVNRTVCVDEGHWVEKPCCKSDCDKCKLQCGPPHVEKEWCSKMVTKTVCVNAWKPTWVEECYNKTVTTMKCVNRTSIVNVVTGYTSECRQREIFCTVCVPTTIVKQVPEITYKCEEIPYTKRYCVLVPYTVEKEIDVPTCRIVKKCIPCK